MKNVAILSFAKRAQKLLVIYIRETLEQPRGANWYCEFWTGYYDRYCLAHAGYAAATTWASRLTEGHETIRTAVFNHRHLHRLSGHVHS